VLEKVVAKGKSKAVQVKGVEGSRSLFPNLFVWRCVRTCFLGQ